MSSVLKIKATSVPENLKTVIAWTNKESANQSENDAEVFLAADPTGCFIGEIDGELVSSIMSVKYDNYSHIGNYITREDCRKKGYGLQMFAHAMEYLKDVSSIGLVSVEAQKHNYEKWGFKAYEKNFRYGKKAQESLSNDLKDLRDEVIDQIKQYETPILGGNRRREFLRALNVQKANYGLYSVDEDNKVRGYGIIRKCDKGYRIGPVIADDKATAEKIISGLQSYVVGEDVCIDVFESNQDALYIMKEQGWEQFVTFERMYAKSMPQFDIKRVYACVIEVS